MNEPRLEPLVLQGRFVRLEPLALSQVDALAKVGLDPGLWRWIPTQVRTLADMHAYVCAALDAQQAGSALPFAIVDQASGELIGSTRYANIVLQQRRLEIGWSWITPAFQRSRANTEAKLLLLGHAFDTLKLMRVEFKTDALNQQSRKAIKRLGAVQEGILRKHLLLPESGRVRDTVYFSILDDEWPQVKTRLQAYLAA